MDSMKRNEVTVNATYKSRGVDEGCLWDVSMNIPQIKIGLSEKTKCEGE